jgi:ParB/RepB/Spo0J family partition protein
MRLIQISDITVSSNRQRRSFEPLKMEELRSSIEKIGLQNPIVVRRQNGLAQWVLISGERRLRAVQDLHDLGISLVHEGVVVAPRMIPAVTWSELDELSAEEAELDENIKRTDLSWQEQAAAIIRLKDLRERQGLGPTIASLAEETYTPKREGVGSTNAKDVTRKILIVARHLDRPEVAKAVSLDEAFKALKRAEETARNIELATTVGKTFSAASHKLFQDDALSWMALESADQFDVIITDPPYGIDAQDFGDADGRLVTQDHRYDDSYERWQGLIQAFALESFRLAKPEAHAYICCDIDRFHEIKGYMQSAGWYVVRTPIVNFKRDGSRVPLPEHGPQRKWELVLYAIKGWRRVTRIYPDVVETRGDENLGHGAQKPVGLYLDLLKRSVLPGNRVLDPFAGTGTVFLAAHEMKCAAVGVEIDPNYYAIALKRLETLK